MYELKFAMSGLHLASKSGLGFPNIFFNACVKKSPSVRDRASPSHPVCSSQSFRRQSFERETGAPSCERRRTMMRQTMATITAGAITATTPSTAVEIVSLRYGNDIVASVTEKSRFIGSTSDRTPAIITKMLYIVNGYVLLVETLTYIIITQSKT
jgi:hypothetical protein